MPTILRMKTAFASGIKFETSYVGNAPRHIRGEMTSSSFGPASDRSAPISAGCWNSLQGLEISDPSFDFCILTDVRTRLLEHQAERRLFEHLVEELSEGDSLRETQRRGSAVRRLKRVEFLGEMLRAAPGSLAGLDPDWLTGWVPVNWLERSGRRIEQ